MPGTEWAKQVVLVLVFNMFRAARRTAWCLKVTKERLSHISILAIRIEHSSLHTLIIWKAHCE